MALDKKNGNYYTDVIIDEAPGTGGYWSDPVDNSDAALDEMYLSIRSVGSTAMNATVTVQFKMERDGDDQWQDYETYTSTTRDHYDLDNLSRVTHGDGLMEIDYERIKESGVQWRVGIKETEYTDGTIKAGFDWGKK